ncbi:hypothetical protein EZ456_21085 [Pedobacter psychrodurus]|uniref:Uncharacterized protein n=1 Tax=Pedobacter psychrodurus TaxID=2530456 RepID=A0A4R0PII0_9SPHI|nr:hypothetical protein [Pedobacter psychrodurus]TCD18986.1 hypothetical protein EZ456_21085 [Pedobacter psychrodurus]
MIELDFFFNLPNGDLMHFQLIQLSRGEPWTVLDHDQVLARIAKEDGEWKSSLGKSLSEALIQNIGLFIDRQQYEHLPNEIKLRWPKLIEDIIVNSDTEYMVICKPFVNFRSFEKMFEKFVPAMIKDEWTILFKVYNHDFSEDFTKELNQKKEELSNPPIQKW